MKSTTRGGSMEVSLPLAEAAATSPAHAAVPKAGIPQYRRRAMFAVWAAAALPMAALAWLVAPALADRFAGDGNVPLAKALLLLLLTGGLVWQFSSPSSSGASSGAFAGRRSARRSGSAPR